MMPLRYRFLLPLVVLIASTTFECRAASKHLLQGGQPTLELPDNIRIDPPFPSESPDDCEDTCKETEGCRGYKWRGSECTLTIQLTDKLGSSTSAPTVEPPTEEPVDPVDILPPAPAPFTEDFGPGIPEPGIQGPEPTTETVEPTTEASPTPEPTMTPDGGAEGIPDSEEEIQKFLLDCQDTGSLAAAGAALAACSVITNRCPIPEEPDQPSFEPVALSDGIVPAARDALNMSLTEACQVLVIETCKNEAFNQAQVLNPECHLVLDLGPGVEDVAEGCENLQAANILFSEEVAKICETTPPDDRTDG